jgi:hypothetical protein
MELVLSIKTTVPGHPRRTHSPRYQLEHSPLPFFPHLVPATGNVMLNP